MDCGVGQVKKGRLRELPTSRSSVRLPTTHTRTPNEAMAPAAGGNHLNLVAQRRLELAGKPGIAGLLANGRTLSIAVFASLVSLLA
jgi:hypothetical protein